MARLTKPLPPGEVASYRAGEGARCRVQKGAITLTRPLPRPTSPGGRSINHSPLATQFLTISLRLFPATSIIPAQVINVNLLESELDEDPRIPGEANSAQVRSGSASRRSGIDSQRGGSD